MHLQKLDTSKEADGKLLQAALTGPLFSEQPQMFSHCLNKNKEINLERPVQSW